MTYQQTKKFRFIRRLLVRQYRGNRKQKYITTSVTKEKQPLWSQHQTTKGTLRFYFLLAAEAPTNGTTAPNEPKTNQKGREPGVQCVQLLPRAAGPRGLFLLLPNPCWAPTTFYCLRLLFTSCPVSYRPSAVESDLSLGERGCSFVR